MKFTSVIRDDNYEKITLTEKWNNGDWNDIRFALKTMYLEEYLSEEDLKDTGKYEVSILAVSPEAAKDNIQKAIDSMGMDIEDIKRIPLYEYEALLEYGIFVTLWHKQGNNLNKLLAEAKKEFIAINMLFGFYMDKYVNMIGDTGWDWIQGNVGAGLNRILLDNNQKE